MIRHVLLIQFKATVTPAQITEVMRLFKLIPAKIPGVVAVEWGENNSPEGKNRNYTHCVLMSFADEAGRDAYLPHPEHDALRAVFSEMLEDIVVIDYTVA